MSNEVMYEVNGVEYCDEELAVSILLKEEVLFVSFNRDFSYVPMKFGDVYKSGGNSIVVVVNCGDVFAWGCADAEDLAYDEIPKLYKMFAADNKWGSTKWCCIKRNQQPQEPIKNSMIKDGSWNDELEKLPENNQTKYFRMTQEEFDKDGGLV